MAGGGPLSFFRIETRTRVKAGIYPWDEREECRPMLLFTRASRIRIHFHFGATILLNRGCLIKDRLAIRLHLDLHRYGDQAMAYGWKHALVVSGDLHHPALPNINMDGRYGAAQG